MANWAITDYVIEGPKDTLKKIEEAIKHPKVEEGSSENWEGNVLHTLGFEWESRKPDGTGKYMRGFIGEGVEPYYDNNNVLIFSAQEAYGVTDFNEVLEENLPDIKIFYRTEEPDNLIYATNDVEGKYFPDRFYVDTCINGNYAGDYFKDEESMWIWLAKVSNGQVKNQKDVEHFNENAEVNDYIEVNSFEVIDNHKS